MVLESIGLRQQKKLFFMNKKEYPPSYFSFLKLCIFNCPSNNIYIYFFFILLPFFLFPHILKSKFKCIPYSLRLIPLLLFFPLSFFFIISYILFFFPSSHSYFLSAILLFLPPSPGVSARLTDMLINRHAHLLFPPSEEVISSIQLITNTFSFSLP